MYHKDLIGLDQIVGRCDITGVEKPRVNLRDGKWYAQMPDSALYHHLGGPRHLFYLCPEATRLYIKQVWMSIAWMENHPECSHDFVHEVQGKSTNRSLRERGDLYADWNKSYYQILTNQSGKEAWPIPGATFILVYTKPVDAAASKIAINFFDWAFSNGDRAADDLDYVALPPTVKAKIRADWKKLAL